MFALFLHRLNAQDTIPPILKLNPGSNGCIELNCGNTPYVDPGAVAYDSMDGNLTTAIIVTGTVDTRRIGVYKLTYSVTDRANNTTVKTRTVCVACSKGMNWFESARKSDEFIFTTEKYHQTRWNFKWYVDGKYLRGADWVDTIHYYFDDTLSHQVCLDQYYCQMDTPVRFCMQIRGVKANGISGSLFTDENKNCGFDTSEWGVRAIPVRLLDTANNLLAIQYSNKDGSFHFQDSVGKFKIEVDTAGLPVHLQCAYPGKDTLAVFKNGSKTIKGIDFGFSCNLGFDIIAQYCGFPSRLRPGETSRMIAAVSDQSWWYGLKCLNKVNCKVKLTLTGKMTYVGVPNGALTPDSINSNTNTFVYMVQDLSKLDPFKAFALLFRTDTTAFNGDSVIVTMVVTTPNGDIHPANNTCIEKTWIRTSYDPNFKEVFPAEVLPGYADWLTYTVHFQNTGNAPAYNIKVKDTLDEKLDVETFELLYSSHAMQTSLKGGAVQFYFPDIELPDSNSDEPHSHGVLKYRIKPKNNLPDGTKIDNTAYIYFDYNKAVVTNTAVTEYRKPPVNSVLRTTHENGFSVYPNPGSGIFSINSQLSDAAVEIYTIYGSVVYTGILQGKQLQVDMTALPQGYYLVKLKTGNGEYYQGLIKE